MFAKSILTKVVGKKKNTKIIKPILIKIHLSNDYEKIEKSNFL